MTNRPATSNLPPRWTGIAGTVTYLCVDAGRSGPAVHQPGEAQRDPDRLVTLVAAVASRHGGEVLAPDLYGNGVTAAFPLATGALVAAAAILQAGSSETGQGGVPVLRLALHTGAAGLPAGSPAGSPVAAGSGATLHRCHCLRDIAHSGQALVSLVTAELARDALPPDLRLRDLGAHRLRDLGRAEQVFQLICPGTADAFPPLRSLDVLPHNLPYRPTSFVGREREMVAIRGLLTPGALVTLTGPGGCGKTRLALQVAAAALDHCPDGAWLVDLAPLRDPELVPQAVSQALGLQEEPGRPLCDRLIDYCRSRRLLLVLDNCEHLVAASAALADTLLQSCPHLRLLATSREALAVQGETVWPVPPLSLPGPGRLPPLASLTQYEAVRLFIDRALVAQPRFAVTNQNAPAVAQICQRLDGIPLAIELAAVRVKLLSAEEIAERLDQRFRLLKGGSRSALPRHQTLQAAVDWSHDLLAEPERALFRRLAVFAGGFSLGAAEAVAAGNGVAADDVLDLLSQLVERSLVLVEEGEGETRYRMLETIREYADEALQASGEATDWRRRHRDWYLALAERAEPELPVSRMVGRPGEEEWQHRLEQEYANLRAALQWSLDAGDGKAGLRLAGALGAYWRWRAEASEGCRWLGALLPLAPGPTAIRAKALNWAGQLASAAGDYHQSASLLSQSCAAWAAAGEPRGTAAALHRLAWVMARFLKEFDRAAELLQQSLDVWASLGDEAGVVRVLVDRWAVAYLQGDGKLAEELLTECLARARAALDKRLLAEALQEASQWALFHGDYARALPLCQECLVLARELGDRRGVGWSLIKLGSLLGALGHYEEAEAYLAECLAIRRAMRHRLYLADSLEALARVFREKGQLGQAADLCRESLTLRWEIGDRWGTGAALDAVASLAAHRGEARTSACLYGAAAAVWEALGEPLLTASHRADRAKYLAVAKSALPEADWAPAWAEGRGMALPDAVAFALAGLAPEKPSPAVAAAEPAAAAQTLVPPAAPSGRSGADPGPLADPPARQGPPAADRRPGGLTAREIEIVRLVAEGLTDREVAARLFISPRTVDTHLRNIFAKAGVTSRAGLATWAGRQGLVESG